MPVPQTILDAQTSVQAAKDLDDSNRAVLTAANLAQAQASASASSSDADLQAKFTALQALEQAYYVPGGIVPPTPPAA